MASSEQNFMPPTLMGNIYWKQHIVAVVPSHEEAERAVAELANDGHTGDTTRAWPGSFVVENHAYYLANRSLWQRLGSVVSADEGAMGEAILEAARQGASIVTVAVPDAAQVHQVRETLVQHGASRVVYYGANTVEDL